MAIREIVFEPPPPRPMTLIVVGIRVSISTSSASTRVSSNASLVASRARASSSIVVIVGSYRESNGRPSHPAKTRIGAGVYLIDFSTRRPRFDNQAPSRTFGAAPATAARCCGGRAAMTTQSLTSRAWSAFHSGLTRAKGFALLPSSLAWPSTGAHGWRDDRPVRRRRGRVCVPRQVLSDHGKTFWTNPYGGVVSGRRGSPTPLGGDERRPSRVPRGQAAGERERLINVLAVPVVSGVSCRGRIPYIPRSYGRPETVTKKSRVPNQDRSGENAHSVVIPKATHHGAEGNSKSRSSTARSLGNTSHMRNVPRHGSPGPVRANPW